MIVDANLVGAGDILQLAGDTVHSGEGTLNLFDTDFEGTIDVMEGRYNTVVQAANLVVEGVIVVSDDYPDLDFGVSYTDQNLYLTAYAPGEAPPQHLLPPGQQPYNPGMVSILQI